MEGQPSVDHRPNVYDRVYIFYRKFFFLSTGMVTPRGEQGSLELEGSKRGPGFSSSGFKAYLPA